MICPIQDNVFQNFPVLICLKFVLCFAFMHECIIVNYEIALTRLNQIPVKFWTRRNWNNFLFLGEFPTACRALPRRAVEGAAVLSTWRTAAETASPLRHSGCRLRAPQRCAVPCRVKIALGPIRTTFFVRPLNTPNTLCSRSMYNFRRIKSRLFIAT